MFREWFTQDPVMALLYILAIPATVILLLQTILLLFGGGDNADSDLDSDTSGLGDADGDIDADADTDVDVDHDGGLQTDSGLRLFTVRGLVAFFAVGGWSGIAAIQLGASHLLALIIALVMGIAALFVVALFFKLVLKLQYNGTLRLSNAVGQTGEVYLTVPANAQGSGKVNVIVQEQLIEASAVSYGDRPLRFGEKVKVTGKVGEDTLVVEPLGK